MNLFLGLSLGLDRRKVYLKRPPGTFDAQWTLYNRGLNTLYQSPAVQLESGGDYTLEPGLEIKINGIWTDQPGTLVAGDVIRVRATSLNEYFVNGISGTLALKLTIDGTDCTFTLINMVDPATLNASFPYTFPFELG